MTDSHDEDLPILRAPAHGHRSDAVFARAVSADVARRRRRFQMAWLAAPGFVSAAALIFALTERESAEQRDSPPVAIAGSGAKATSVADDPAACAQAVYAALLAVPSADIAAVFDRDFEEGDEGDDGDEGEGDEADESVIAFSTGALEDESADFAFPGLSGSTEGELADIEAALDRALRL